MSAEDETQRLLRLAGARGPLRRANDDDASRPYFDTYAELVNYHERLFRREPCLTHLGTDFSDGAIRESSWLVAVSQVLSQSVFLDLLATQTDVRRWYLFLASAGYADRLSKRPFAKRHLALGFAARRSLHGGLPCQPPAVFGLSSPLVLRHLDSEQDLLHLFEVLADHPPHSLDRWGDRFIDLVKTGRRRQGALYRPDTAPGKLALGLLERGWLS
jgi:hypothetical protein